MPDGQFHFPPIHTAHLYEKLDGTNVLAYRYHDVEGPRRLTYKLRLAPTLRNSKWGPFLDYWRELLDRHPDLPGLVEANDCHVSFEMFGARNVHFYRLRDGSGCRPALWCTAGGRRCRWAISTSAGKRAGGESARRTTRK